MITAGQTYVEGDCRRCGDQLQIRETWSRAEVTTFLAIAASDRLCVVWRLSLRGLRRGEAPSLRWPDINLRARMLTVIRPGSWSGTPVRIEEPEPWASPAAQPDDLREHLPGAQRR
jgi:integrase